MHRNQRRRVLGPWLATTLVGCGSAQSPVEVHEPRRLEHAARVHDIAEVPAVGQLVGGGADGRLVVWSLDGSKAPVAWKAHQDEIVAVACSPDGSRIVSGCRSGMLKCWHARTRELAWESRAHQAVVADLCFSADGILVSVGHDTTVRVWDVATGNERRRMAHQAEAYSVAITADGAVLLTGGDDQCLCVWDIRTGEKLGVRKGLGNQFSSIAVRRDGVLVSVGPRLCVYESFEPGGRSRQLRDRDHHGWLTSVDFAPDGRQFATGGEDGVVRIWQVEDGNEARALRQHSGSVWAVAYVRGGELLAAADDRGVLLHRP